MSFNTIRAYKYNNLLLQIKKKDSIITINISVKCYFYKTKMKHIYTILLSALLCSCANVIPPNGGPKDTNAPTITSLTPETNTLNFSQEKIIFTFDEKIVVDNFYSSFFISPPLNKKVDYAVKANKLIVALKEELKNNTTYYMSIGQSIADLNEGNKTKEASLLFSTGPTIDTLYIEGYAQDVTSGKGIKDCSLFLHTYEKDNNYDNIFSQANYVAKTNEDGFFSFPNLRNELYHLIALQDLDKNLNYSLPDEKIGFLDSLFVSQKEGYNINLFTENDSIGALISLKLDSISRFGKLIVDSIPSHSFLELYNDQGIVSRGKLGEIFIMDSLLIGEYQLRLIKDSNRNGVWDSGNLESRIKAEDVLFYPQSIRIRSNWDLEISWETKL